MKRLAVAVAALAFLVVRVPPSSVITHITQPLISVNGDAAVARLSAALNFETVAGPGFPAALAGLHAHLRGSYPAAFKALALHELGPPSSPAWLLEWPGTADLKTAAPAVLVGHLDVVPGTTGDPTAFSGSVADGWIVGRGALDAKGPALAMLEAVEALAASGWAPSRTLFLSLGADEETGGAGADAAAAFVASRLAAAGARPSVEWLLDEGGVVLPRPASRLGAALLPGPVALVGVSEKGWATVRVSVRGRAGHAAQPHAAAPGAVLAAAAAALHGRQPPPTCGTACVDAVVAVAAASGRPAARAAAAVLAWPPASPLRCLLARVAARFGGPATSAALRPTIALTELRVGGGGAAPNVVPASATATFNARPLPGEAPGGVAGRVEAAIAAAAARAGARPGELAVTVSPGGRAGEHADVAAPPLTPWGPGGPGWAALAAALGALAQPHAPITPVPYILPGGTDSRHWAGLAAGRTLRWCPMAVPLADVEKVHGAGERLGVASFLDGVQAYARLIQAGCGV